MAGICLKVIRWEGGRESERINETREARSRRLLQLQVVPKGFQILLFPMFLFVFFPRFEVFP